MPETPEVETEKLREAIHEELEREGGGFLRAGATANEALVLKTEAARLQAEASDQWAYYQAKGVKAAVQEATRTAWLAAGKEPPPDHAERAGRYAAEQEAIAGAAREKEKERDARSAEADHLLHQHHRFASAVAFFQVAIALGAVAALTRLRLVWLGSLAVGLAGLGFAARALLG